MSADAAIRLDRVTVEYVAAGSISPNSYNNHRHTDDTFGLLLGSMEDDGFTTPILVDEESREIVDGEHRWLAWIILSHILRTDRELSDLNVQEIRQFRAEVKDQHSERIIEDTELPVIFVDFPPTQKRISGLRHNRARGYEDPDATADLMIDLLELGSLEEAQDALRISDADLAKMIPVLPPDELLAELDPGDGTDVASDEADSMTQAAVEERQKREEGGSAGAEEEKEKEPESGLGAKRYRLVCCFTGVEVETVKSVLGNAPTRNLLTMCQHMFTHQKLWTKIIRNGKR